MTQLSDQSYYEILEVAPDASRDEITRAYHRSKSAYSTNSPALYSVFSKEEATEILKLIDEAYSVLINQDQRRNYDRAIAPNSVTIAPNAQKTNIAELPEFAAPASFATTSHTVNTVLANRSVSSPRPSATPPFRSITPSFTRNDAFETEIENAILFDGTFLAKIRQYKNITIEQISDLTRVGKHYLRALEINDQKALPAPVFVRGFTVQYAKVLGLDERKVADSYMKNLKDLAGKPA